MRLLSLPSYHNWFILCWTGTFVVFLGTVCRSVSGLDDVVPEFMMGRDDPRMMMMTAAEEEEYDRILASDACAEQIDCWNCTSSSRWCHWCAADQACHARGSPYGCFSGADCTDDDGGDDDDDNHDNNDDDHESRHGCAAHTTCMECATSSRFCHWCAHDNACHTVGSYYGCTTGVDCFSNDRCKREEPEPIHPNDDNTNTSTADNNSTNTNHNKLVDRIRHEARETVQQFRTMRVLPLTILLTWSVLCLTVATLCFGCVRRRRRCIKRERQENDEYQGLPMDTWDDDYDDEPATTTTTTIPTEHVTNTITATTPLLSAADNSHEQQQQQQQQQQHDENISNSNSPQESQSQPQHDEGTPTRTTTAIDPQGVYNNDETTTDHAPAVNRQEEVADLEEQPQTVRAFTQMVDHSADRHRRRRHRRQRTRTTLCDVCCDVGCGLVYGFVLLFIVVSTIASIRYFPKMPIYNVCNDNVAWKSLVDSMTSMKVSADFEILISVVNENPIEVRLLQGGGSFYHASENMTMSFVGNFTIPPVTAEANAITDLLILAHFTPQRWEAFSIGEDYYQGKLILYVNANATIQVPALHSYTFNGTFSNLTVHVNQLSDRHYCHCPSWDQAKNNTPTNHRTRTSTITPWRLELPAVEP